MKTSASLSPHNRTVTTFFASVFLAAASPPSCKKPCARREMLYFLIFINTHRCVYQTNRPGVWPIFGIAHSVSVFYRSDKRIKEKTQYIWLSIEDAHKSYRVARETKRTHKMRPGMEICESLNCFCQTLCKFYRRSWSFTRNCFGFNSFQTQISCVVH